jgi:hypothetical protein
MEQGTFTLKSGSKLHLSMGPWELVEKLYSAVKTATHGKRADPEAGSLIIASLECMAAVRELYPWATYDNIKMYSGIFDEPKLADRIRADSMEIKEKMIEFHLSPFFLMTSSASTDSTQKHIENQRQP